MAEVGTEVLIIDRGQQIKCKISGQTEKAYKITRHDDGRYAWFAKSQFEKVYTYSPVLGHNAQLPPFVKPVWKV